MSGAAFFENRVLPTWMASALSETASPLGVACGRASSPYASAYVFVSPGARLALKSMSSCFTEPSGQRDAAVYCAATSASPARRTACSLSRRAPWGSAIAARTGYSVRRIPAGSVTDTLTVRVCSPGPVLARIKVRKMRGQRRARLDMTRRILAHLVLVRRSKMSFFGHFSRPAAYARLAATDELTAETVVEVDVRDRRLALMTLIMAIFGLGAFRTGLAGQTAASPKTAAGGRPAGSVPRTSDGRPDLQGVWSFATLTPLERPADLAGKAVLTDEEAKTYEQQVLARNNADRRDGPVEADVARAYNNFWYDRGLHLAALDGKRRTSLIADPAD